MVEAIPQPETNVTLDSEPAGMVDLNVDGCDNLPLALQEGLGQRGVRSTEHVKKHGLSISVKKGFNQGELIHELLVGYSDMSWQRPRPPARKSGRLFKPCWDIWQAHAARSRKRGRI